MATKTKKLFGKNILRLSSMLLTVVMLVSSVFTGVAPVEVKAETGEVRNTLQLKTDKSYIVGQNVILDIGKTYSFSYYYERDKFVAGLVLDGNDAGDTQIAVNRIVYDDEYNKVTYEFVAPETATSAGEGKVRIYLGIQKNTNGVAYHFYGFDVHAVDDETKTNLFNDPYFSSETSLFAADGVNPGNWYKPYAGASGKLNTGKFYAVSLESLGGMDFFKKTDADRFVLKQSAETSSAYTFGQVVSLEAGKTYIFSNYYKGTYNNQTVAYGNATGTMLVTSRSEENDWFKGTTKFTVPSDAPDDGNGKKLIWVGITGYNAEAYYYDFKLYDIENTEVNLFADNAFVEGGTDFNSVIWKAIWGNAIKTTFSKATLQEAGGMDFFKKTDADRFVLKLEPETTGQPVFGQTVSLKAGETYVFSNYFMPGTEPIQCISDGNNFDNQITYEIIEDMEWSKQGAKFTVPDSAPADPDIEGNKLIWVGFRGHFNANYLYYYGFELYNVNNPDVNLLGDSALVESATPNSSAVWKSPAGSKISAKYSRVTLESAGGMDIFKKPQNMLVMNTSAYRFFGQNVILEVGKKYSYSFYYEAGKIADVVVVDGNDNEGVNGATVPITNIVYDEEYNKVTYEFIAPEDATPAGESKVRLYLGLRKNTSGVDCHFYGFNVHAVADEKKTNLFSDSGFTGANALYPSGSVAGTWHTPYTTKLYNDTKGKLSTVNFDSKGGLEFFKKTDAHRYVIKLESQSANQPYFGQKVSLVPGKTYIYTNYYLANTSANLQACYLDATLLDFEVIDDKKWSKQSIKFTVPEEAPNNDPNIAGNKLIWVGFRGNKKSFAQYYYGFKLYDIENPEVNLLKDYALQTNGLGFNVDIWKTPGGNNVNYASDYYSEVTLESIGGINTFFSFETKCDVNGDGKVDICDLVRMKRYQDKENTDAEIPDGRGDLDNDGYVALDSDLLLLKKELLKK